MARGLWLAHASCGHGFTMKAVKAMIACARTISRLQRMVAIVDTNNRQSVRVLEKVSMTCEAEVMFDRYGSPDHSFVLALH
ncbi:MAG: GNAT family N-acetyltransferase [Pseudomonadota bacterium]